MLLLGDNVVVKLSLSLSREREREILFLVDVLYTIIVNKIFVCFASRRDVE